jgi:hypothetical protein
VIQRLEASGLGARRFCEREGLSEDRLHWWRRRLRGDQGRHRPGTRSRSRVRHRSDRQNGSPFLSVGIPVSIGAPIEVVHPRGHIIRVPAIFDTVALGQVLAAIDAPAGTQGAVR